MYGSYPIIMIDVYMQNGSIAETYDPLWPLFKSCKINFVNDPYRAITPSSQHDRLHRIIVQHLLQVCDPFLICSSESECPFADCVAEANFISPFFDLVNGGLNFRYGNKTSGSAYANAVAAAQESWYDNRVIYS